MALENSAEAPLPVRTVARSIADWVGRLGRVWVEGQVTQLTRRPGTVFLTLRDPVADVSLSVTCARGVVEAVVPPLSEGDRVVVHGQPVVHLLRGSLQLQALDIRPVGVGELLARLERLKGVLRAEGLFDADRKKPLPFLPRTVGLITGRASAAERDVLENARRRWPAVPLRRAQRRRAGAPRGRAVHRRARRPRPRAGGRRHRDRPRRWQRRGPAAVQRRGAVPCRCRLPHAGRQRDRSRARQPAGRRASRTSAAPRRPMPASGSCPTTPRR